MAVYHRKSHHTSQSQLLGRISEVWIVIAFVSCSTAMERITDRGGYFEMLVYQAGMLRILSIVTRWPMGFKPVLPCGCGNHPFLSSQSTTRNPESSCTSPLPRKAVYYESPSQSSRCCSFSSVFYTLFFKSLLLSALSSCLLPLPLYKLLHRLFSCPSFARRLVNRHRLPVYVLLYFYFIPSSVSIVVLDHPTPPSLANSLSEKLCFTCFKF
jgi:hypothetical protein